MPQDPQAPQDPHIDSANGAVPPAPKPLVPPKETPEPARTGSFDLNKILLPKKEVHSSQSAQRINAGILLEQEQSATLAPAAQPTSTPTINQAPVTPTANMKPLSPKAEESTTPSLQTYRGDIEHMVESKNVSVVSIAAAEAQRRGQAAAAGALMSHIAIDRSLMIRISMIVGGVVLVSAAIGLVAFVLLRTPPEVQVAAPVQAPFISVDSTKIISPSPRLSRTTLMASLTATKQDQLSLGLIERFYVTETPPSADNIPPQISLQTLLPTLSPSVPQELLRTLDPERYVLGIHSFDENQPFLILQTDTYQQAFSGMLTWEKAMQYELAPLFTRTPSAHISADTAATSTATTSTPFTQTGFIDRVVENHEARAIVNEHGDILLLWTFLDQNTIVITTNEYTLREIISRRKDLSIVPQL